MFVWVSSLYLPYGCVKTKHYTLVYKVFTTYFVFCRRRTRLSTIRALGVLMLWMIPYFFIEVYHYRRALYRTDLNVPKNERVQLSHYLNSSRDKSLAIDTLIEFWEREQVGEYKITNYKDLWEEVRAQHHGDTLFPETYDADKVLYALRRSKIIEADLFKKQTSLKFKLTLEGGQRAIFKVKLM